MSLEERINRCFDVSALACVLAALALCVSLVSCSVSAPDAPSDTAAHHSTQVTATKRLEAPDAAGNTADNSAAMGSTARDRIAGLADMWERESGSDGSKSEGAAEEALSIDNAPFTFDGASTIEEWYRLPEYAAATGDGWYLDENDVWRDGDGYVVLTASGTSHDMGDIIETSHGPGRVVSLAMPRISSYGVNGKVYEVVRVATAW